jgi:hypothetical protein
VIELSLACARDLTASWAIVGETSVGLVGQSIDIDMTIPPGNGYADDRLHLHRSAPVMFTLGIQHRL